MSNSTPTPSVKNDEWTQAAGKARDAAASVGEMASHAVSAVGAMVSQAACDVGARASQAACDVGKKANDLTASTGVGIQELSDRLLKNAPHTGALGSVSQAVAGAVKEGGEYLEGVKLSGMTEDLAQLVRRNPIPSVVIAIGLGWFVGRKLKG